MPAAARGVLLLVAFVLEMVAFVAFPALAWLAPVSGLGRVVLAVLLGVLVIWFWSRFMAPRAAHPLGRGRYLAAKAVIYGVAAVSIHAHQGRPAAAVFVAVAVLDELLVRDRHEGLVARAGDRPG